MGLDIHLRPKNRDYDYSIDSRLSRRFCNLLCGPDVFENSELNQLQKLHQIDLSILRRYPINVEPDTGELEYQLYLAEEKNDLKKVRQLNHQIEQKKADWNEHYDKINEGWTELSLLEEIVDQLRKKLIVNPNYHSQLHYNFDWGDYFHLKRDSDFQDYAELDIVTKESTKCIDNILIEDLQSILDWIQTAKQRNIEYATFSYE